MHILTIALESCSPTHCSAAHEAAPFPVTGQTNPARAAG
jgi:hypothetical protein